LIIRIVHIPNLEPDPWLLIPGIRSFGARLEPRYIFGAGRLDLDQ